MKQFFKNNAVALILIAVSVCFVAIGIYRDEVSSIFNKAIFICTQCIGIG